MAKRESETADPVSSAKRPCVGGGDDTGAAPDEDKSDVIPESPVEVRSDNQDEQGVEEAPSETQAGNRVVKDYKYPDDFYKLLYDGLQSGDNAKVRETAEDLAILLETKMTKMNSKEFVSMGGHGLLIAGMKRWKEDKLILRSFLRCLLHFTLCHINQKDKLDIPSSIIKMGGLELCVDSMVKFPSCVLIQSRAMTVIGGLIFKEKGCDKEFAAEKFVNQMDGVSLACKAMKMSPKNETLQRTGCFLLGRLCERGQEKHTVMKETAILAVCQAVHNFPFNDTVNSNAGKFMAAVFGT